MERLDVVAFEAAADVFDSAVSRASDIDPFCSASAWTLAASAALMPPRELVFFHGEHGWGAFARRKSVGGFFLEPLEMVWGLGCPIVPEGDARALVADLASVHDAFPRDVLVLSGIVEGSPLLRAITDGLEDRYAVHDDVVPVARRFRASLERGLDGFLARRSPTFRAKLRRSERKAAQVGITWEVVTANDEASALSLHTRMLEVEARSWKGRAETGLIAPEMARFYREMLPRLARKRSIRALFGRLDERDVAFIVGAVVESPRELLYRGLQFSFDDAHRALALGNVAQLAQVARLSAEGVTVYDLGAEVEYKKRWGEGCLSSVTLVAVPL